MNGENLKDYHFLLLKIWKVSGEMDFFFELFVILLIAIPIYLLIRIMLISFYKKLPWMEKLHEKISESGKEKAIFSIVFVLCGIISFILSEIYTFSNLQLGAFLGLFLGASNIFDSKMLKGEDHE